MVRKNLIKYIFIFLIITNFIFADNNVLSGGDIDRNPVLGCNFLWGEFGGHLEVELDIGINKIFSIAPRLGVTDFNWFTTGCSFRFGIIKGIRPHGFWAGPSIDVILYKINKNGDPIIVITGEFGWRYTFKFGLSLQPITRLGFYVGDSEGFYWNLGVGVGYAF